MKKFLFLISIIMPVTVHGKVINVDTLYEWCNPEPKMEFAKASCMGFIIYGLDKHLDILRYQEDNGLAIFDHKPIKAEDVVKRFNTLYQKGTFPVNSSAVRAIEQTIENISNYKPNNEKINEFLKE